jgi:hypothetical protein
MKDIRLPKFNTPGKFVNLCDIVESHTKKDSLWAAELATVIDTTPGQVKRFMEHPIKAQTVLQQLNTSLVNYRVHVVEIRGVYAALMEQHKFPWAQTCEELFISCLEYDKSHPFQVIS